MSVIINEFEIVVEPPPEQPGADFERAVEARHPERPPSTVRPIDLYDVLRLHERRRERVRAH